MPFLLAFIQKDEKMAGLVPEVKQVKDFTMRTAAEAGTGYAHAEGWFPG